MQHNPHVTFRHSHWHIEPTPNTSADLTALLLDKGILRNEVRAGLLLSLLHLAFNFRRRNRRTRWTSWKTLTNKTRNGRLHMTERLHAYAKTPFAEDSSCNAILREDVARAAGQAGI